MKIKTCKNKNAHWHYLLHFKFRDTTCHFIYFFFFSFTGKIKVIKYLFSISKLLVKSLQTAQAKSVDE